MSIALRFALARGDFSLDIDVDLPSAGITAIYGPSGGGKTTLLRCIAGLEQAQGHCALGTQVWQDERVFLPPHQRQVGYVFQQAALFPHLTVRGNLHFAAQRAGWEQASFDRIVASTGVGRLLSRNVQGLSGGEAQRVALARALLSNPQLLLLDEPLASLDRASKSQLLPVLEQLHRELEIPVIYVSHALNEIARLADYVLHMEHGEIVKHGPVANMLTYLDLYAGGDEALSLISATVLAYDAEFHLNLLEFSSDRLLLPGEPLTQGDQVRVAVAARDVSLTLTAAEHTSILNIIPVTVTAIEDCSAAQVLVQLRAGETDLVARITRKSAANLNLRPGLQVFAQIKSVSLVE
jgi:molybdate transport system ATP-binding protein